MLVIARCHIALSFTMTLNNVADCKLLKPLLERAKRHGFKITRLAADKAFDAIYMSIY
ncbi:MAG: hypothetical protein ACTSRZ_10265 [Promethearchaeota archaeon]